MSGFLLDSNVVSEVIKPTPEPRVISFLAQPHDMWLSVMVLHEARYGLNLMPHGHRRESLRSALSAVLVEYANWILPINRSAAEHAARLRANARRSGRVLRLADALIAGTAMAHGLTIVTRNIRDFDDLGLDLYNPWDTD